MQFKIIIAISALALASCGHKSEDRRSENQQTEYVKVEDEDKVLITSSSDCGDIVVDEPISSKGKDIVISSSGSVEITAPIDSEGGDVTITAEGDIVVGSSVETSASLAGSADAAASNPCSKNALD